MKLTIFAATGGTGRQLLSQAVAVGKEVRKGLRLSRADAAHCMLDVLGKREMFRQSIAVGY